MKTITEHWLDDAVKKLSPHHNDRPDDDDISLLVIHNISLPPAEFGGDYIEQFFLGQLTSTDHPYFDEIRDMRVSAHCVIKRDGTVIQFVPFNKRAWHAGLSSFQGRDKCNDFSIGIELEGTDDIPYEAIQYQVLAEVTNALLVHYPHLTRERIAGHQDIAPLRKTDPGKSFDWTHFYTLIAAK